MKVYLFCVFLLFSFLGYAQIERPKHNTSEALNDADKSDSILGQTIHLDEVKVYNKVKFKDNKERLRYLILMHKVFKVYPYARLAAEQLDSMQIHLKTLKRERDKNRYIKEVQKHIETEFSEKLKKLSQTEGQILVKLIERQTGNTAFNLVKDLRSGWRAFWYNSTASLFNISLKKKYDPEHNEEDFLIEDIILRNVQNGRLAPQEPVKHYNLLDLYAIWKTNPNKN